MQVQERSYTMPALAAEQGARQLRFLGVQVPVNVQQAFTREHSSSGAIRSLDAWERFEQRHPSTFWGMYQCSVEKR